tara:strand:+ start:10880 stop:11143 length:264 start_codon:yes stop_codon:yes gene_type:complete
MSVNITENKFSSSTNVSVGDYDVVTEGKQMYDNKDVKFPVKKVPANNEMFSKGSKKKMTGKQQLRTDGKFARNRRLMRRNKEKNKKK